MRQYEIPAYVSVRAASEDEASQALTDWVMAVNRTTENVFVVTEGVLQDVTDEGER